MRSCRPPTPRQPRGQIPELAPCEAYCHSLTDPSILGPELRAAGAQTLTVFGLHMPARLFRGDDTEAVKQAAVEATLRSLNSVLAEPIEDCLALSADGEPCLEARTPVELEGELAMPGGHIFHRDLAWPFAESDERGRPLGRRDRAGERLDVRCRRPPGRRRQWDPRPQRGPQRCSRPIFGPEAGRSNT